MESESKLEKVVTGYKLWLGEPGDIVVKRRAQPSTMAPNEIHVLFFPPIDGDGEDNITTVATAGMSVVAQPGSYPYVELGLELKGNCAASERGPIATCLADLASVPFLHNRPFEPNLILEDVTIPLFANMHFALVTRWDRVSDIKLPDTDPPVIILRLTPLYKAEADLAGQMGDVKALTFLEGKGMDRADFNRGSILP